MIKVILNNKGATMQETPSEASQNNIEVPPQALNGAKSPKPFYKNKRIVISTVAVLAALLVGGVASAMWWTSPEKSLSDAMLVNEFPKGGTAKGDILVTPKEGNAVTIAFDSKYKGFVSKTDLGVKMDMGAMKLDMTGGVATTAQKSVLFRFNDVRDTIKSFARGYDEVIEQYYGKLIDKVDNKWVEVTESDLKETSKDSGTDLSCFMDKSAKMINNKAFLKEAGDIYNKNAYFSIKDKVGSEKVNGRDSNHIVLAYDKAKAKAYGQALEKTSAFKELKSCVKDAEKDPITMTEDNAVAPKIELWVDKWSHKVNKVVFTQDEDGTMMKLTAVLGYNDNQAVDTPKADTQFKDLKSDKEALQEQFSPSADTTQSTFLEDI